MMQAFKTSCHNLEEKINQTVKDIEQLILLIINEKPTTDSLKNWLYDDYDRNYKVVDYIAIHEFLEILNHPKIVKTVDTIWMGKYDLSTFVKEDLSYLVPIYPLNRYSYSYGINADDYFSILRPGHILGFYKYSILS